MVGSNQCLARTQLHFEFVLETWPFFSWFGYEGPDVIEGDFAQRHNDANLREQLKFARQVWFTIGDFLRLGPVQRRSTMKDGSDIAIC